MEEDTGLSFKALILKGQKDEAKGMNVLRMEEVRDTPPLPGEATIRIYTASLNRRKLSPPSSTISYLSVERNTETRASIISNR